MGPGAAAKGRRGPAGAVPGPKLALVALAAAVVEPFRAISADNVGGNDANRRNSHLRRYVGAQRLVAVQKLKTMDSGIMPRHRRTVIWALERQPQIVSMRPRR